MLCPSRKIWIWYLKVARPQLTFSWKMGIQYPPRPAGYFDSLLTPYRYGAKTTQIWTLNLRHMSYSSNVRYSNKKHQKMYNPLVFFLKSQICSCWPHLAPVPSPMAQIKKIIKGTIEPYQDPLTSFWVGAKMTLEIYQVLALLPWVMLVTRCQPGRVLEN